MARQKKPENETVEQARIRQILESVSNNSLRSEKTSWNRKMDNMVKLIAKIRPIEQQILDLMADKMPIADDVAALRSEMVKECIHPLEQLVYNEDVITCKFCNRKIQTSESNG